MLEIFFMNKNRYIVQIDFYIHAKSDNGAVRLASWLVRKLCLKFDNQARLTGVWNAPFGSFITTKIENEKIMEAQDKNDF